MLNPSDIEQMRSDLLSVRDDNDVSVSFRRGNVTLNPQTVRIARTGSGGRNETGVAREVRGRVVLVGGVDLDVQVDDRFNADGRLYRVTIVRPNRVAATIVDAEISE